MIHPLEYIDLLSGADELEKQRIRALYVINNGIDELVNESNSGRAHVRAVELLSELAEVLNGISNETTV